MGVPKNLSCRGLGLATSYFTTNHLYCSTNQSAQLHSQIIQLICIKDIYRLLILSNVITLLIARKMTVELKTNVRRRGNRECFRSTVTLGELFLICQQKHRVFFFPSLWCMFCVSSTIWALGTAEPLFCMTGIGKSGGGLQTAAGSQSFNACLSYSYGKGFVDTCKSAV